MLHYTPSFGHDSMWPWNLYPLATHKSPTTVTTTLWPPHRPVHFVGNKRWGQAFSLLFLNFQSLLEGACIILQTLIFNSLPHSLSCFHRKDKKTQWSQSLLCACQCIRTIAPGIPLNSSFLKHNEPKMAAWLKELLWRHKSNLRIVDLHTDNLFLMNKNYNSVLKG